MFFKAINNYTHQTCKIKMNSSKYIAVGIRRVPSSLMQVIVFVIIYFFCFGMHFIKYNKQIDIQNLEYYCTTINVIKKIKFIFYYYYNNIKRSFVTLSFLIEKKNR